MRALASLPLESVAGDETPGGSRKQLRSSAAPFLNQVDVVPTLEMSASPEQSFTDLGAGSFAIESSESSSFTADESDEDFIVSYKTSCTLSISIKPIEPKYLSVVATELCPSILPISFIVYFLLL